MHRSAFIPTRWLFSKIAKTEKKDGLRAVFFNSEFGIDAGQGTAVWSALPAAGMENCSGRGLACRLGRCFCLRQRVPPGTRNPWATFFCANAPARQNQLPANASFNPTAVSLSTQPAWFAASAATTPSLELLTLD